MSIENLTANKAQELVEKDLSKETPYDVATAFGFNWKKDRQELAKDAGINGYLGKDWQNLKIKKMLLNKLDELKNKEEKSVVADTKSEINKIYDGGTLDKVVIVGERKEKTDNVAIESNESLEEGIITSRDLKDYYLDENKFNKKVEKISPAWKDKEIDIAIGDSILKGKTTFENGIFNIVDNSSKIFLNDRIQEITKDYIVLNKYEGQKIVDQYKILNEENDNAITKVEKISNEEKSVVADTKSEIDKIYDGGTLDKVVIVGERKEKTDDVAIESNESLEEGIITSRDLKDYYLDRENFNNKVNKIAPFWKDREINLTIANTIFNGKTNFEDGIFKITNKEGWEIGLNGNIEEMTKDYIILNRRAEDGMIARYKILNEENDNAITKVEKISNEENIEIASNQSF